MNIERLGRAPPPSLACGAAPGSGDGAYPPPCPDGETGWQSTGVALPGPSDKEVTLLPEIQPSFVNRRFPLLLLVCGWPQSRSRRRSGCRTCPGPAGQGGTSLAPKDRHRLRRAGPNPAPHMALAVIVPSAANFVLQPRAVPAVPIPRAARRNRARREGEQGRRLVRAGAGVSPVAAGLGVSINLFFRLPEFSHSRLKLKG